jgi:hypothetical protein
MPKIVVNSHGDLYYSPELTDDECDAAMAAFDKLEKSDSPDAFVTFTWGGFSKSHLRSYGFVEPEDAA